MDRQLSLAIKGLIFTQSKNTFLNGLLKLPTTVLSIQEIFSTTARAKGELGVAK